MELRKVQIMLTITGVDNISRSLIPTAHKYRKQKVSEKMTFDTRHLARRIRESLPEQGMADSVLEARIQNAIDDELKEVGDTSATASEE